MRIDAKSLLSGTPDENWQNAVDRLWKTFEQCKSTDEFVRTYIMVRDCMYDWLGKLNMSRHLVEMLHSGADVDSECERYIRSGWNTAFSEERFQFLARKYQVPDSEFQRITREYKTAVDDANIAHCSYCNFGIPIIKGFDIKVCPSCAKPWELSMRHLKITMLDRETGNILSAVDLDTGKTVDLNNTALCVSMVFGGAMPGTLNLKFSALIPITLELYTAPDQPGGKIIRIKTCEICGDNPLIAGGYFLDIAGEGAKDEVNNFIMYKLSSPEFWFMDIPTARKYGCV